MANITGVNPDLCVQDDNGASSECRIGISVITVKGSFLLVMFDVVETQVGHDTWAALLSKREGLSENAD